MISLMLSLMVGLAGSSPKCSRIPPSALLGTCVEGPNGVALASNLEVARALLKESSSAEARFEAHFGRKVPGYAVFATSDPSKIAQNVTFLRARGFTVVLPIPSSRLNLLGQSSSPPTGAVNATGLSNTFVNQGNQKGLGEPRSRNFVAHELGHRWYSAAFWPDNVASGISTPRRYGSPAPDWLDEAAAMLTEDEDGQQTYVERFADGRSQDIQRSSTIPPEVPLETLLSMEHPALAAMPVNAKAAQGAIIRVIGKPSLFYSETKVFVDYLIARTNNPRVLTDITLASKRQQNFSDWLKIAGSKQGLPRTIEDLQKNWDLWNTDRFGSGPNT